jgi:hypothetical protein
VSDICLFLSTDPSDIESALIRRFTMCDWSHVGFYRISDGSTFSAMNDGKGVAWRPANPKAKLLLLQAPKIQEAFEFALTQEGKAYDVSDILGFITDRDWQSPDKFICDRLVFASFVAVGAPLLNPKFIPQEHLTPRDVLLSPLVQECVCTTSKTGS